MNTINILNKANTVLKSQKCTQHYVIIGLIVCIVLVIIDIYQELVVLKIIELCILVIMIFLLCIR
jgi:hypothetical protein